MTYHQFEGQFTLHIHSVGEWTTSRHSLIKEWVQRQAEERRVVEMFTLAAVKVVFEPNSKSRLSAVECLL